MKNYFNYYLSSLVLSLLFCGSLMSQENIPLAKKRVLVGSPIRQKPAILKEFLDSLNRLDQNIYTLDFFFIDDNDKLDSRQILMNFLLNSTSKWFLLANRQKTNESPYVCSDYTHYWTDHLVWKVASFKDEIIKKAAEDQYDYLFLIDSDIVLHPQTITQLINANKDIISNIFWTVFHHGSQELPQVWISDMYTLFKAEIGEELPGEEQIKRQNIFLNQLRQPGVYPVGGLGACTLISKKALEAGMSFSKIKNVSFWGEDRHFCIRAVALGLDLHVDTHYPAYHIYREANLEGVEAYIQSVTQNKNEA